MSNQARTIFSTTGKISRKNNTGADIEANRVVMSDPAFDDGIMLPAAADSALFGITGNKILIGEWGDVITLPGSVVPIKNNGGVARGARLTVNTAGEVVTAAPAAGVNVSLAGVAMRTDATAIVTEVLWAGPGVSRQG